MENREFRGQFFQTGKTRVICQKILKICFYTGNLTPTQGKFGGEKKWACNLSGLNYPLAVLCCFNLVSFSHVTILFAIKGIKGWLQGRWRPFTKYNIFFFCQWKKHREKAENTGNFVLIGAWQPWAGLSWGHYSCNIWLLCVIWRNVHDRELMKGVLVIVCKVIL